ncbi:hypothetical protein COO60DRAFT_404361 [Scenedesmus sp. NREL 46B-D3]|nr:hypothetical protein COO60DRAFT_404361 [Scenedesmus sp. NREL 46B-D3]
MLQSCGKLSQSQTWSNIQPDASTCCTSCRKASLHGSSRPPANWCSLNTNETASSSCCSRRCWCCASWRALRCRRRCCCFASRTSHPTAQRNLLPLPMLSQLQHLLQRRQSGSGSRQLVLLHLLQQLRLSFSQHAEHGGDVARAQLHAGLLHGRHQLLALPGHALGAHTLHKRRLLALEGLQLGDDVAVRLLRSRRCISQGDAAAAGPGAGRLGQRRPPSGAAAAAGQQRSFVLEAQLLQLQHLPVHDHRLPHRLPLGGRPVCDVLEHRALVVQPVEQLLLVPGHKLDQLLHAAGLEGCHGRGEALQRRAVRLQIRLDLDLVAAAAQDLAEELLQGSGDADMRQRGSSTARACVRQAVQQHTLRSPCSSVCCTPTHA